MRSLLALFLLFLSVACSDSIVGLEVTNRLRDVSLFRADFLATASCFGLAEDSATSLFNRTEWYHAPSLPGDTTGMWVAPYRIYLKRGLRAWPVVRNHEALHLMIQRPGHRHPAFGLPDIYDACETPGSASLGFRQPRQ